jgi:hypothetical protein
VSTDNRTTLNACDSNSGWGGDDGTPSSVTAAGLTYENANSLSFQHTNAPEHTYYTDGTGWNLADAVCFLIVKVNQQDSQANGGMQYVLGDGTDRLGVETNGSDNPGVALRDLFYGMNIDTTILSSFTQQNYAGVNANLTLSAITQVGYGSNHLAKAQGAVDNIYLDRLSFIANDSAAFTINGGTVGTPETWTDFQGDDSTNGWGVCGNPFADQFQMNASFDMGDAGTASTYFEMDGVQLYLFGQAYGAGHFFWDLISNATGTNSLEINGSQIISIAGSTGNPIDLGWNSANFDTINVDGSIFVDVGNWELPGNSATRWIRTSTIDNPISITPNGMEISDTTINQGAQSRADGMMILDTAGDSNNMDGVVFNSDGTGHAIEITAPGAYTFTALEFNGYDAGTDANGGSTGNANSAIYNNSGGAVTITVVDGATPSVRDGTGASTTVVANIALTFTPLELNTEVRILETGTNTEVDGVENSGTSFVATVPSGQAIDIRIINPGWLDIETINVSFTSSQSILVNQQFDRNFDRVG